ncbi:ankyrin repeat protein [Seminavis robusta]|uniref:Ankyrin repeat protein n=1 Tax=Seminavis robusta TaxID=568900 RepID=A0A9N8HMU3_9STRA|nr:ankyrin repeat protein [Seminavis robusta]|eukprot:Sro932_g221650.1 ankyrin repeat protein (159) ;mRNA; f:25158-25634
MGHYAFVGGVNKRLNQLYKEYGPTVKDPPSVIENVENECPWDERTCSAAAEEGNLELLKWARAQGCPWNDTTCKSAAGHGRLELLKWARENGCPWDEDTCLEAAVNCQWEILKWARAQGCPWDRAEIEDLTYAFEEIRQIARENGEESEDDEGIYFKL